MSDAASFRAQLHTSFHVITDAGRVTLALIDVTEQPISGNVSQFALLLHGPPEAILPQGTYELDHDRLGRLVWFMVPVVGSNRDRAVYQVCFSSVAG